MTNYERIVYGKELTAEEKRAIDAERMFSEAVAMNSRNTANHISRDAVDQEDKAWWWDNAWDNVVSAYEE